MSIQANPDWWRTLFDDVYLLTDARSVGSSEITRREVDLLCDLLALRPHERILDLCGGHGRHSFELCSRGFQHCTLVDYSACLIERARAYAAEHRLTVEVLRRDARRTGLDSGSFDHVLILGNSLGYLPHPEGDRGILTEAKRVLRPGGSLLVDVVDGAVVRSTLKPNAWHEIGEDCVVCREREIRGARVYARELVLSKRGGLIRDRTYSIHLYESDGLKELLEAAGFADIRVVKDVCAHRGEGDYGFMNHRMVITACRR